MLHHLPDEAQDTVAAALSLRDRGRLALVSRDMSGVVRRVDGLGKFQRGMREQLDAELRRLRELEAIGVERGARAIIDAVLADPTLRLDSQGDPEDEGCVMVVGRSFWAGFVWEDQDGWDDDDAQDITGTRLAVVNHKDLPISCCYRRLKPDGPLYQLRIQQALPDEHHAFPANVDAFATASEAWALQDTTYEDVALSFRACVENLAEECAGYFYIPARECEGPFSLWWPAFSTVMFALIDFARGAV